MFEDNYDKNFVTRLVGIPHQPLRQLLIFMYNKEVHVSEIELPSFLDYGKMLKVKGIMSLNMEDFDTV